MPTPASRPDVLRGRVFRGSTVVASGLLTRKQLRSGVWRRLRQDVYADAAVPLTHRVQMAAVSLALPAGAGFAGRSAALLWGVPDIATADDPVEVVVPRGDRWHPGPGVVVRRTASAPRLERIARWPCTSRIDTAVGLIRHGDPDEAVVLLDRLLAGGLTTLLDVQDAVAVLPRGRGSAQARRVAGLADGHAESPQETRLRLLLVRSGLPAPITQFRVFDDDGLVARVDLAYPDLRIAIEYDGLWHGERKAFLDDRRRLNRLAAAGWVVVHVTLEDLRDPARLLARVHTLRAERVGVINAR